MRTSRRSGPGRGGPSARSRCERERRGDHADGQPTCVQVGDDPPALVDQLVAGRGDRGDLLAKPLSGGEQILQDRALIVLG